MTYPVAIVNPRAAGGRAAKRWPAFEREIERQFGGVTTHLTERPNHATELTAEALEQGAGLVIAVGGDGTANEAVNGWFRGGHAIRPEAKLGFVPLGTGGDFQRTLAAPTQPAAAAEAFASDSVLKMDLGLVRLTGHDGSPVERYFVNLASFGMGGDVSVAAKNCFLTNWSGKAAFFYATFMIFLRYRGKRVTLRFDGDPQEHELLVTNVAAGNGRFHGAGMQPCPLAALDDGLLDVTAIENLSMFELVRDIRMLYSGEVYRHPKVRRFQVTRMTAESDDIVRVEVDGESLGRLPLEARALPRAIRVALQPDNPLVRRGR